MSRSRDLRIACVVLTAICLCTAFVGPSQTEETSVDSGVLAHPKRTGVLHGIQFNVCNQVGQTRCSSPSTSKTTYIKGVLTGWSAQTASFQEICRTTFDGLRAQLGDGSWDG